MLAEQKVSFLKMNGAGNDFIIFDASKTEINLSKEQIQKLSNRNYIGCDQLIIIKNDDEVDCQIDIYNSDGSISGACGNATRCVASLIENDQPKIRTAAGVLECKKNGNLISVKMGIPKFLQDNLELEGFNFSCLDIGNPHAVTFIKEDLMDKKFFEAGPKIENNPLFPNKTNVEFAKIISNNLIEVRVWERGAGETLACGSGACAVGIFAIKKGLINANKVTTRFKGGDLEIKWSGKEVIMTGGYELEYKKTLDEEFFN